MMGFHIQLRVNFVKSKKTDIKTSESRLLEVLYVKSKKKTQVIKCRIVQVSNCLGDEMSHTGAELSGFRTVLVPKCLIQVPKCPGAELSRCRSVLVPNCPGAEVSSIQVVSLSRKMLKKNVNLKKGKHFFSFFLSFCLLLFFWYTAIHPLDDH